MTTRPTATFDPPRIPATLPVDSRPWQAPNQPAEAWINSAPPAPPHPCTQRREASGMPVNLGTGRFSLQGPLTCDGCQRPLHPVTAADGTRGYRAPCGCRLTAVDAVVVERLVRDAVHRHSTTLVADVSPDGHGHVFTALFLAVRIGGSTDDLRLVWRM